MKFYANAQSPKNQKRIHTIIPFTQDDFEIQDNNCNLFYWWFLLGYYCACVPFKPVKAPDGSIQLQTNKLQKVVCLFGLWFLNFAVILTFAMRGIKDLTKTDALKATNYFEVLYSWLFLTKHFSLFWILLIQHNDIEHLLNLFRKFQMDYTTKIYIKITVAYVIFVHLSKAVATFFLVINKPQFQNFAEAAKSGRSRFFLGNCNSTNDLSCHLEDIGFGTVELILRVSYYWTNYFLASACYGALPLSFWLAVKEFNGCVAEENVLSVNEKLRTSTKIVESYDHLRNLTECINSVWSATVLLQIVDRSFRLIMLHERVSSRKVGYIASDIADITFMAIAVILMAEGSRTITRFKGWMIRHGNEAFCISEKECERIFQELETIPIGIGSEGLYHINYSFVSQLLVLIITLFVIGFQ